MFDRISPRYDFMNRFLSARIDLYWRKKAISRLQRQHPRQVLDVATGTADMALLACQLLQPDHITGIDISEGMLQIGREKVRTGQLDHKIDLQTGDAEAIKSPDHTFDAVMVAFGVRNFENLQQGLQEMRRVLKPGGTLVVLEFAKPRQPLFRLLYDAYMGHLAPRLAKSLQTDSEAYTYLNRSANAFPDHESFTRLLLEAGYAETTCEPLTFGICCLYTAKNPH